VNNRDEEDVRVDANDMRMPPEDRPELVATPNVLTGDSPD
jgi:hypothetical protein